MWIYKELEKRLCRCLYILFLTAASFADFCIFSVPPPSLGIVSVPRNWTYMYWLSITYICRFYILRRKVALFEQTWTQLNVIMTLLQVLLMITAGLTKRTYTENKATSSVCDFRLWVNNLAEVTFTVGMRTVRRCVEELSFLFLTERIFQNQLTRARFQIFSKKKVVKQRFFCLFCKTTIQTHLYGRL